MLRNRQIKNLWWASFVLALCWSFFGNVVLTQAATSDYQWQSSNTIKNVKTKEVFQTMPGNSGGYKCSAYDEFGNVACVGYNFGLKGSLPGCTIKNLPDDNTPWPSGISKIIMVPSPDGTTTPKSGDVTAKLFTPTGPQGGGGGNNCNVNVSSITITNPPSGGSSNPAATDYAYTDASTIRDINQGFTYKKTSDATIYNRVYGTATVACPDYIKLSASAATTGVLHTSNDTSASKCSYDNKTTSDNQLGPTNINITKTPPANIPGDPTQANNAVDSCPIEQGALRWILCPLYDIGQHTLGALDGLIANFLYTPTDQIFNKQFRSVTNTFRNLALALLVIAGLVMVIGQAAGVELFDAYTVRKIFPRLLFAAIGIALAWPILQFIVSFFNDLGRWSESLLLAVVPAGSGSSQNFGTSALAALFGIGGVFAAFVALTAGGMLSLVYTGIVALLVGLVVLALRQMVILVAVLFAPLAIAAYILPGTQKIWKFWKDAFITSMIMFPIIMVFLGAGKALSYTLAMTGKTELELLALIVYFAPYFLLPFAFKLAGGLMSTIFSIANDKGRGIFDKQRKYREGKRAESMAALKTGERFRGNNGFTRRFNEASMGAGILASGNLSRSKYQAARTKLFSERAAKMLEADGGRSTADDDATAAAMKASSAEEFRSIYTGRKLAAELQKESNHLGRALTADEESAVRGRVNQQANQALAALEVGMGAKVGTNAMKAAAFKARAASNKGYGTDDAALQELYQDANGFVEAGIMSASDAAGVIKSNKTRLDYSGAGWGSVFAGLEEVARTGTISTDTVKSLRSAALAGQRPGDIIFGHTDNVKALAPEMEREFRERVEGVRGATTQQEKEAAERDIVTNLASLAGRYDAMAQASPDNAKAMDEGVLSQTVDVATLPPEVRTLLAGAIDIRDAKGNLTGMKTKITIRQAMDSLRGNDFFVNRRREYMDRAQQMAAAAQGMAGAPGTPGSPGASGPTPGG